MICNLCYIYCFSGFGAGKTTNALGLALRSLGHGHKVLVIQFLKWWKNTGEYLFKHPNYRIKQFGRKGWIGLSNLDVRDIQLCKEGVKYLLSEAKTFKPHLIILDEINLALSCGLLDTGKVIEVLDKISIDSTVILTGRYPPPELIARSDFYNEIVGIKSPKENVSEKGIQY